MMDCYIGCDVGGSHVAVGLIDADGSLIFSLEQSVLNNTTATAEDIVQLLHQLCVQICGSLSDLPSSSGRHLKLRGVGIGCPGQSKDGVIVAASNYPLFNNAPLAAMLSELLQGVPVVLMNDADAAIAAEVWGKESRDRYENMKNCAMITLGTGIGLGLVLNGALYQGSNGLVEGGHMIIATSSSEGEGGGDKEKERARPCGCGQQGCVEAFASARSLSARYEEEQLKRHKDSSSRSSSGNSSSSSSSSGDEQTTTPGDAKSVFRKASQGDLIAASVIDDSAMRLAVMCINICRIVDPQVIIFGGGMAQAGEEFLALVRKHIKALTWTVLPTDVQIVLASASASAGIIGAALAAQKHVSSSSSSSPSSPAAAKGDSKSRMALYTASAVATTSLLLLLTFAFGRRLRLM